MSETKTINPANVPTKALLKRFKEAEKARKKYDANWARNTRLYKSKAWKGVEKIAWFQSEPEYNKCFEYVEIMRGFLSDNMWGLDVIPASLPDALEAQLTKEQSPEFDSVAERMGGSPDEQPLGAMEQLNDKCYKVNKLLDFLWGDTRMQSKLAATMMHMFLKGTGIVKSTFDPDDVSEAGIGQIEVTVVDPFYFYPDPDATSMHDGAFYIEKHPVSVRWVLDRYPDKAEEFLKTAGASSMDSAPKGDRDVGAADVEEGKRVDILEYWYRDSAVLQEDDEESGAKAGDKKYPNGRYTLMTDKEIVLDDKPAEYMGNCGHPYTRWVEIPMPNEFWGECTLDKVASLQLIINQLLRSIIDNGLWMVHGIWIADDNSGVTPETMAGYGMRDVVVKKTGSSVTREVGEPLPHTIFQTLQDTVEAYNIVAGIPDILRGIAPSRQPVGTSELQRESGEVRTRERSRRVEEGLEDLGKLWLTIVSKFWNDKRMVRNQRAIGGFDMFSMSKDDLKDWSFDLHVRPGSTTPLDVAASFDRAKSLRLELQIPIPDDFLVRLAQIPGLEASMLQVAQDEAAAGAPEAEPVGEEEMAGLPFDEDPSEGDQFPSEEDELMQMGGMPEGFPMQGGGIPPEQEGMYP